MELSLHSISRPKRMGIMGIDQLVLAIADLNEAEALQLVRSRMAAGEDAFRILNTCQEGVRMVGKRYERGEYFIAGLIMGGVILQLAVQELASELDRSISDRELGTIVLGTVEGDIHDIGKNIVSSLLSCNGFKVIDLGIDVPSQAFIEAVRHYRPSILGLSCLLTTAVESMKDVIADLDQAGLRSGLPIIIGGNALGEEACAYAGADYWTSNAMDAVGWCLRASQPSLA